MDKYITWLKAHEKLIIICVSAFLVFHFYGSVLNTWTEHDKRQIAAQEQIALITQQKVQVDTQANAQLFQQLADLKLQYLSLSAQLQQTMQKRAQQTQEQKKKNESSTPSEIASRTIEILHVQPNDIIANGSDNTLIFSAAASHVNVNALEDGVKAEADVIDLNKQLVSCTLVTAKQDETITGVRKELSDEKVSHIADVTLEQGKTKLAVDEGKKQFRKGFKWGIVTGIGISIAAKIGHVIGF